MLSDSLDIRTEILREGPKIGAVRLNGTMTAILKRAARKAPEYFLELLAH